jgi:hypothetical protein
MWKTALLKLAMKAMVSEYMTKSLLKLTMQAGNMRRHYLNDNSQRQSSPEKLK